jgi:hypothetical protein
MVMGTQGTMFVASEKDLMLYREIDRNTWKGGTERSTAITTESSGGKTTVATSPSLAGVASSGVEVPGTLDDTPSRGYREELEHFAYCLRNGNTDNVWAPLDSNDPEARERLLPRCRGEVALADAVIALTSNLAMRQHRRIEFDPSWFDYTRDDTPDESVADLSPEAVVKKMTI